MIIEDSYTYTYLVATSLIDFSRNSTSSLLFRPDVLWTYWIIAFLKVNRTGFYP